MMASPEPERDPDRGEGYDIGPTSGGPDVQLRRRRAGGLWSDDWIQEEIRRRVEASSLAGSPVEIVVEHGAVTLRGRVSGPTARRLAEQIAGSVAGVQGVQVELETDARGD